MAQWIPAYLEERIGVSKLGSAFGLALFSGAMALGRMGISGISSNVKPLLLLRILSLSCTLLWPTIMAVCSDRFSNGGATMFTLPSAVGNGGGMIAD